MTAAPDRMRALIERHWRTNRVPVGDDTTALIHDLAAQTGGEILTVPSGAECLTWIIPPKWTVREAWLASLDGTRIADFAQHPLYLKSYSAPFEGVVSRDELLAHVRSDPARPDRLLYDYRAQYEFGPRTAWGFTLPHRVVESLTDAQYRVHIDAEFAEGEMQVLDWTLPGEQPGTIFFAAHSCHPALVNDGLACIAAAVELFRWLAARPRRHTWRLIIGPEYYAAAAFLARARGVENLRGGFYLDMLANSQRLGFSRSWRGDSPVDLATRDALGADALELGFRALWANDEMFYDGPDFEIPTVTLGRDKWPHYHTDFDDVEHCDFTQLADSLDVMKQIVASLESRDIAPPPETPAPRCASGDTIVTRKYRGPLYQARHGLHIDVRENRAGYFAVQDTQRLMDGHRSCAQIATQLGIDFDFVKKFADALIERGLAVERPA